MTEHKAEPEVPTSGGNAGVTNPRPPAAQPKRPRDPSTGRFLPYPRDPNRPQRGWKQGRPGQVSGYLGGTKRPWDVYWRRRALKPKDRWALPLVRDYVPALMGDKPDATAAEQRLMELAGVARLCWALALSRPEPEGGPDFQAVARFSAEERSALVALGLERRAKQVDPLDAVKDAVERANDPE